MRTDERENKDKVQASSLKAPASSRLLPYALLPTPNTFPSPSQLQLPFLSTPALLGWSLGIFPPLLCKVAGSGE